jgi:glycosyltransferase involved in cell wall biosynthesis
MKKEGFGGKKMVSINNGLDQNEINNSIRKWTLNRLLKFQAENNLGGKDIFISIGRVIEGRFDLMLDAVKLLSKEFPNVLWVLIGKGEGERKLKQKIREKSLEQNVLFTGAIYQENEIAPWMMSALGYVHPAPIGLSLLHAYGYGLPVITTNEVALQGPEFCAFEEGKTGLLYQDGNAESLSVQCRKLLNSQQCFEKDYIAAIPKDKYNTDIMYTQLVKIINA